MGNVEVGVWDKHLSEPRAQRVASIECIRGGFGLTEATHRRQCPVAWGDGGRAASALPRTRAGRRAPSAISARAYRTRSSRPGLQQYRVPSAWAAGATPSAVPGCPAGTSRLAPRRLRPRLPPQRRCRRR